MSAIPAYTRTWLQLNTASVPGTRITYVSLIDLIGHYGLIIKTLLLANGCTLLWSCDGTTGPTNSSDHTDRVTAAANFETQTAAGATATSYYVITDGNGGQLLVSLVGSTNDVCRIAYSPTAAYVLSGTSTHVPTASDELVISTGVTIVGATTSTDRVVHGCCSSDGKAYRFTCLRSSAIVGQTWCVEAFTATVTAPATVPLAVFAGSWSVTGMSTVTNFVGAYNANVNGGFVRSVISSTPFLATCNPSTISGNGSNTSAPAALTAAPELQGGSGFIPWPMWFISVFTGSKGVFGTTIDWYVSSPTSFAVGDGFGSAYDWWQCGPWLWPNPLATAPTIA